MNLNPFDLRGPEFLVFYAFFSLVVLVLLRRAQLARERRESALWAEAQLSPKDKRELEQDPYRIAYLCGGRNATIQTAILSLLERGLLETLNDGRLRTTAPDNACKASHPLDKAILGIYADPGAAQSLYKNSIVITEVDGIRARLCEMQLLPGRRGRFSGFSWALCALWLVAGIKILVAFSRGHHNVMFLVGMAFVASIIAFFIPMSVYRTRTPLGETVFKSLRVQFDNLYARRKSLQLNGQTGEIALLAAVFGAWSLSDEAIGMSVSSLLPPVASSSSTLHEEPLLDVSLWGSRSSCGGSGGGGGKGGSGCGGCG
jgi:uncharacterized protein (TIGR04222 family)